MMMTMVDADSDVSWWMGVVPIWLQFVGRWGLYLRLCALHGLHSPNHALHDQFEWRKQPTELAVFVLSYLLAKAKD